MADWLPKNDGQKIPWYEHYKGRIETHGPNVGLNASQILQTTDDLTNYATAWSALDTARNAIQAQTATVRAQEKQLIAMLRAQVKAIKSHAGYTQAIGEDLDIIAEGEAFDPNTVKPTIKVTVLPGEVVVAFPKGDLDGINLYRRLEGQTTFQFVARDTNSPYNDHSPLAQAGVPEVREYCARGVINDEEVGLMSDIVKVTFPG